MAPPRRHTPAIPPPWVLEYTYSMVNSEGGLTWTLPWSWMSWRCSQCSLLWVRSCWVRS